MHNLPLPPHRPLNPPSDDFRIRKIGYLTLVNIGLLGLKFGVGSVVSLDHMHAFLFLQAAPLVTVARAMRAHSKLLTLRGESGTLVHTEESALDEFLITAVEPWLAEVQIASIETAREQLVQLDEITAAPIAGESSLES